MSSKNCFQVPPGLSFGPDLPPLKLKVTKSKRKKVKSRAEAERARKSARKERRERRAARLQRRAARKEEEKQRRAESGEPQVTKIRIKRDLKSHHGTESVDITILKLLGKSHKSKKVAGKGKTNEVEKNMVGTQQGQEGAKWKPGMREEPSEGWQEERKLKQQAEVESSTKKKKSPELHTETVPKTSESGVGVVPEDLGPDIETDLHWDPHKAAGSCSQETLLDSPPTPSLFSDVPSSPTIPTHSPLEPMPPCMEFYQVRR